VELRYYRGQLLAGSPLLWLNFLKQGPKGPAFYGEAAFDASSEKFTKRNMGLGVTNPKFHAAFIQ
jgi:hypothetical protein